MSHPLAINTLPLLDLALLDGSPAQRGQFLDDLRHAARHIGFSTSPATASTPGCSPRCSSRRAGFSPCRRPTSLLSA